MDETQIREEKRLIYATVASGASDLYKMTLTVASSFLGGSLLFLERFAPHPSVFSKLILGLGWLSLVLAVGSTVYVQLLNNRSGCLAVDEKWDQALVIQRKAEKWTTGANWFLIVGMGLIMFFGFVNLL